MKLGKTLYVADRKAWRSWLAKHHKMEKEIWLIYYRKSSGKPRIHYNDAVEEALCFGWIDSIVKKLDDEKFVQRFSPRRPKSRLSQPNKERISRLLSRGLMTKAGLDAVAHAFKPDSVPAFKIPKDILRAIKHNQDAWAHFQKLPLSYVRIRIAYIDERRPREELFRKSLRHFIKMTAKNKRFGFMRD